MTYHGYDPDNWPNEADLEMAQLTRQADNLSRATRLATVAPTLEDVVNIAVGVYQAGYYGESTFSALIQECADRSINPEPLMDLAWECGQLAAPQNAPALGCVSLAQLEVIAERVWKTL